MRKPSAASAAHPQRSGAWRRHPLPRRAASLIVVATTGFAIALAAAPAASAATPAPAAEISTDYPAVQVQAGQSVTLDLNLSAKTTERVGLSVAKAPKGWKADIQGGGFTIEGAYVGPDKSPAATLHVQVPGDAKPGPQHVVVEATSDSGTKKLDVELDVVTQASDAFTMTSQFDTLQGSTTDSFDFTMKLANNTGKKATFALTASGPDGWTVTASPASQDKASAVEIDGGATSDVTVSAKPSDNVQAGKYQIQVAAVGGGTQLTKTLNVEVVGSAKLKLQTANQVLNASGSAGKTSDVHLTVTNNGTAPLQGVALSSTPPTDWKVTFDPKQIDTIAPGKSADVVAHIQPAGNAITGDYQVDISAKSAASNGDVSIRYTIETSSWWGLIGIVVIIVVVVGLLWMFRRFGRR